MPKKEEVRGRRKMALAEKEFTFVKPETTTISISAIFRNVEGSCILPVPCPMMDGRFRGFSIRLATPPGLLKASAQLVEERSGDVVLDLDLSGVSAGEKRTIESSEPKRMLRLGPSAIIVVEVPVKSDVEVELLFNSRTRGLPDGE